jgi:hypothetical protein
MKSNSSIFLFSPSPRFNKAALSNFETFDKENSCLLYSSLIINHKEVINSVSRIGRVIYCFDSNDKELIPPGFKSEVAKIFYGEMENVNDTIKFLSDKYFNESDSNLIIFSNSIGIKPSDIQKVFKLLTIDDDSIVIGKTNNEKVAFIGFKIFNKVLFSQIKWDGMNFDYFLAKVNKFDYFVYVLDGYMYLDSIPDFRNLYHELSKKESLAYCSQKMHERFTHLFIEYKELLK